jgi:methyl-accepting chemotaxis protein
MKNRTLASPENRKPVSARRIMRDRPREESNGHRNGGAASRAAAKDAEVLMDQPPISEILRAGGARSDGLRSVRDGKELDKTTVLTALVAFRKGDFSARLPIDLEGMDGKIADAFNDVIEMNQRMSEELERLSRVVGKEGKISQRAEMGEVTGAWKESVESVNALIGDLVHPTRETARVIGAVAKGDLSQTMALEIEGRPLAGEFLRTAKTVNTMVEQLGSFAAEVTRVAREVGT